MKNVFLILVLFGGFAMSTLSAQSCKPADCAPCPPGCCIINCCKGADAASSETGTNSAFVLLAATSLDQPQANSMTRKEMKNCISACKKANVAATPPSCKPAACQPAACQPKTAVVNSSPSASKESSLSRG